jgi:hypothetical protein
MRETKGLRQPSGDKSPFTRRVFKTDDLKSLVMRLRAFYDGVAVQAEEPMTAPMMTSPFMGPCYS